MGDGRSRRKARQHLALKLLTFFPTDWRQIRQIRVTLTRAGAETRLLGSCETFVIRKSEEANNTASPRFSKRSGSPFALAALPRGGPVRGHRSCDAPFLEPLEQGMANGPSTAGTSCLLGAQQPVAPSPGPPLQRAIVSEAWRWFGGAGLP